MHELLQEALMKAEGPISGALIQKIESVSGGCIHNAWRLTLKDGKQLFAKTASLDDFPKLSFEADGLNSLKRFTTEDMIEIPQPLVLKKLNTGCVLLLPWLDLGRGHQSILGKGLALIHQSSTAHNPGHFGWSIDGFIGSGPQIGGWSKYWGECFVNFRLLPQLRIGAKWGINLANWKELLTHLIISLEKHKPQPSLVHGDLWSGNVAIQKNGKGVIFDPAVWWADREVDIAMTRLFGGFSNEFYEAYESIWPLPDSAKNRIDIYNLYHLLNHANIFGGAYKSQCILQLENMKKTIVQ